MPSGDWASGREVNELRAAMYATVRDAEHTAVPKTISDRIRVRRLGSAY